MKFKEAINQLREKINAKHENIPSDISDKALTLALYYVETEIRKRGGGLEKSFTDKFYELGKTIYKKRLIDIKHNGVTDDDINRLRRHIADSVCLKHVEDGRDFDL